MEPSGGVLLAGVCACFLVETEFVNQGVVVQPRVFLGSDETELTDPGVDAHRELGERVSSEKTLASVRATDGDGSVVLELTNLRRRCTPWDRAR